MQSKRDTHIEVLTNQFVGIILGWLIVYLLFPFFNYLDQVYVASISSIIFFISSYCRSYLLRRFFNK